MSGLALGLVLLAATLHATWNLLVTQTVAPAGWAVVALSALLEAVYYWTLSQAYRYGDLSLVYPLARGSAPSLVPPLLYGYLLFAGLTVALVPLLWGRWSSVGREWKHHRASIVVVGLLTP